MNASQQSHAAAFRAHGFVVLPAFVDETECAELRRICDSALHATRTDSRDTGHSTPRISLFTDAAPEVVERVAGFFASPRVCRLLDRLALPTEPDAPVLKDVHYYHEQTKRDWDGDWHRDSQFGRTDLELERRVVESTTSLHVRVALEHDDRLEIVPGSHARWDTPDELQIRKGNVRATPAMPGAVRLVLRAGDACIFHAWSIHRATYRCEPIRRTLDAVYSFLPRSSRWP